MKQYLKNFRSRILAGLIFMVPLFAVILILQKLWAVLRGSGHFVSKLLGLNPVLGKSAIPIVTTLLLLILLYILGWLVKFRTLSRTKDWIETKLLQYIPGYLTYKAQLSEKLGPKADDRIPVWVNMGSAKRPGLLIAEQGEEAIVFFPNSPDSNNGQVFVVSKQQFIRIDVNPAYFMKSLQKFGKDLLVIKA